MTSSEPRPVLRRDYRPPDFRIGAVRLEFELGEPLTRVRARLALRRSPTADAAAPLVLDGERLELLEIALDGRALGPGDYELGPARLVLPRIPDQFTLETLVGIRPEENTALSGLYRSGGIWCTQCEADGFRRITWFLDRPDVMARYEVLIRAEERVAPVLLSNGNRVESRLLTGGKHQVRWVDPHPKPSYLFALVAGDLACRRGSFVTRSGREVALEIWVEPQNVGKCEHALRSLQKAMQWDEQTFGLEYDLDLYMIVAVNDFNMGAMENKGLNVFNSKYVLAQPETATDEDYEHVEGVIGHEYFHNWTGNRVTCRDWFQLTLKEGLTVFRDQQFTADSTSRAVKRITDVRSLRQVQFAEDAGPMAHPIRPEAYLEVNNFYTATVYEKGAEVVRMYHTLLGQKGFRRGLELYFRRHDGDAATCDDFRAAMADANGVDLGQFARWYAQVGTPTIEAQGEYDAAAQSYALTLRQSLPSQPGRPAGGPLHVPVAVGLVGPDGRDLPLALEGGRPGAERPATPGAERPMTPGPERPTTLVLELRESVETFRFGGVAARPVPSLLRGSSAPVKLRMERGREELAFLMAHDSDPFNRWDAGQELAQRVLLELTSRLAADPAELGGALDGTLAFELDAGFTEAFARVLADPRLDGSMKALALTLPSERLLGQELEVIEVDALHAARLLIARQLGRSLSDAWRAAHDAQRRGAAYAIDRASIDRRRLGNTALRYLALADEREGLHLACEQLERADNMTDAQAALGSLAEIDAPERDAAFAAFHARWRDDPLIVDKWYSLQALASLPDTLARVLALAQRPDFNLKNPNRVRALIGSFCTGNQVRFHDASGAGYAFLADHVLVLDAINPQIAARLAASLNTWRRFDAGRRAHMEAELRRIAARPGLSRDVYEIVTKCLA